MTLFGSGYTIAGIIFSIGAQFLDFPQYRLPVETGEKVKVGLDARLDYI